MLSMVIFLAAEISFKQNVIQQKLVGALEVHEDHGRIKGPVLSRIQEM